MSFFSFSRAISHFCSVFRGHLWTSGTGQARGSGGRTPRTQRTPLPSYLVVGSVRMLSRLFILLRSFFLSVQKHSVSSGPLFRALPGSYPRSCRSC